MGINLQQLLDAALVEHDAGRQAAFDAEKIAAVQAALAADAIEDASVLAEKDRQIAQLQARIAELEAQPNPEPEPEPEPEEPTGFWRGLATVWPTAATTGPRIPTVASRQTSVSGTQRGKKFTGTVIAAAGTVFEDCEFAGGMWGLDADSKRVTVRYCRFRGTGGTAAILGNVIAEFNDISGYEDGIKAQGKDVLIRGNYIHDLHNSAAAHNDGIQVMDGSGLIEQNYIKARDTSAIMLQPAWGIDGYTIRHNWLGGADLPLRIEAGCKNSVAYENVIERGHWGYADLTGAFKVYGNIDATTGKNPF